MANRFLNNIKINDSYTLPAADGTADQVITTDGSGQLSFVDQSTLAADSAEVVEVPVKNLQGSALTKGDPVYISGSVGSSGRLEVQLADAGNTAKMPAVGLLKQDLAVNGEGYVVVTGKLRNLTTSPIDGTTPSEGDVIYVKSGGSTGAALTTTKPTGSSNLIQNVGKVGRVSTSSSGTFVVSSILRANDVPNLSTGKIWVGDGNTTESTVVHLDETNNEMGINTNNPAATLHVTRSSGTVPLFQVDDIGDKYFQVLPDSNTPFLIGDLDALGGGVYIKGTYGSIQFYQENSELVRIKDNGNVGIGTTNPSEKLEVSGKILATGGQVRAGSYLESFPSFSFANDTDTGMFSDTANQLEFATAGSSRVTIDPSGNVGIGKSPQSGFIFDANGAAVIRGSVYTSGDITKFNSGALTIRNSVSGQPITFATENTSERMRITSAGNVGIGTTNPSRKLAVSSSGVIADFISSTTSSYIDIEGTTAQLRAGVFGGVVGIANGFGSSAHLALSSSGNVGIGTNNPSKKLEVSGSSATTIRIDNTKNSSWTVGEELGKLEWYGNDTSGEGAGVKGYIKLDSDNIYGAGFDMRFGTTDGTNGITERMVITKGGNVGIGTTNPDRKLEVDITGTTYAARFTRSDATGSSLVEFANSAGVKNVIGYDAGFDGFKIATASTTNVAIKSGGNVGIGTTNPNRKLVIEGGGFSMFADGGTSADTFSVITHEYAFGDENEDAVYSYNGTDGHEFFTGGTDRFNIKQNGNVGIGISNITANASGDDLQIGNGSGGSRGLTITAQNNSGATIFFGDADDTDIGSIRYDNSNNSMKFFTNTSERMRITSAGNVGIGTSNPGYKLHVNGYAAAHRFTDSDNASFYLEPGSGATGQWKVQTPSGYVSIGPNNTSWAHFYTDRSNGYYFDKRIVADTGIFGSYNEDLTLQAPYNTTRMTINSSTGNVGIGTTNPSAKVHASDGGTVPSLDAGTIFLASNTSGTGDYSSMSIISGTSGIASLFFGDTDTEKRGAVRYLNSSDALRFRTANTDRFSIKSNGFVGINTTDPGYHLDIDGEARIGSTSRTGTRLLIQAENTAGAPATTTEIRMLGYESRGQGIFFQDSGNSGEEWFAGLNYSGSWDKYSIGYDASGGQGEYLANAILTVKGSVARVGVKNHDPQADMDVNGTIRATGGTFTSGTSGADSQSSAGIVLRRGRRILSGIPSNSNEDFYLRNLLEHTSSNSIIIGQGGTALISDIALKPGSNGNITFFGSGSEDMRVDSSGNVGIGTSYNPSGYKVNVNGDIGATTGSQLHMFQNGGTGSTNAVIRVTNLDTSNYGQTTPNIYSDSGNYYGNRHCEFATNGTVRGWIGHNGSTTVTYSTTSSDERLKKNIEVWDEDTLNKFRNIQPKKFNFVDQEDTDPKDKGYIAQNMVDSFPEAYPHDYSISQTEGMYSFNPSGMVVYLMKAVKDLIAENDNLKARVEALENA